jgi:hypothetical protein
MTSMRTLKKEHVPKKIVMMNQNNFPRFPLSLNENEESHNSKLHEGQTTPIRKIEELKSRNFIDQKKISSATFQADKFTQDPQYNTIHENNFRKVNSQGE